MIRTKTNALPVTINRYNGHTTPACFSCTIHQSDGGACYTVLHRCDIVDLWGGQEINNRIAELERLLEEGAA